MILLIDNYDSFSYNLYQMIGQIEPDIRVLRNDALSVSEIMTLFPTHIVLSPGPGRPADAGICTELVRHCRGKIPLLGVCLGHQAICEAYGATVGYAKTLMHGKSSQIQINPDCPILSGLPDTITGARYHSLSVVEETLPAELPLAARSEDGEIMAVFDADRRVYGLQFHPESILTSHGLEILQKFIAHDGSKTLPTKPQYL
jgi:anthranilate synthase component 2